jgi:fatty acid desaturase
MHPEMQKEKLEKIKYHKIAPIVIVTIALAILAYMAGARTNVILTIIMVYVMCAIIFGFHTAVVNYLILEKMEFARLPYTEEMDKEYESNHLKIKLDLKKWAILGAPISLVASVIVLLLSLH